jgi:hypothetical protein
MTSLGVRLNKDELAAAYAGALVGSAGPESLNQISGFRNIRATAAEFKAITSNANREPLRAFIAANDTRTPQPRAKDSVLTPT